MAKLESLLAALNKDVTPDIAEMQEKMAAALKSLVDESNRQQNTAFSNVVNQAVLNIAQSNRGMLNTLSAMEQQALSGRKALGKMIDANGKAGADSKKALTADIKTVAASIAKLPTQFPVPKDVDLSGLSKDIKTVASAVKNIPTAEFPAFPKPIDLTPQFKDIKKMLNKRVHVFEFDRDPATDLVRKMTVRVK